MASVPRSLNGQCPSCKKWFETDTSVLRHMNHPRSSCATWRDFLESISPPAQRSPHDRSNHTSHNDDTSNSDNHTSHDDDTSNSDEPMLEIDAINGPDRVYHEDVHPNVPHVFGSGAGFVDVFKSDHNAEKRRDNIYYPFSSKGEWGLASWLSRSGLSMRATDDFLSLPIVQQLSLSFTTAKTLRSRMEDLPKAPEWKMQSVSLAGYETAKPVILFYRDPLEIIQALLRNPIFEGKWAFTARKVYQDPDRQNRLYGDWMTSDGAWSAQSTLPPGGTLLGITLSSDKTNISIATGDRVAHPLLLTLANLPMDVRMKSTYHALPLIALLPCPKFIGLKKSLHGVMENRLVHHCLDIVSAPLKQVAANGAFMADSLGRIRCFFTPLVAYIVDTPEAAVLAGVGGKTSHLTLASHKTFGDHFRHPTRLGRVTLAQNHVVSQYIDPWDLGAYAKEVQQRFRLNGVHLPFWRDWTLPDGTITEPGEFLTPEPLHHWHKQFWDHDAKWCIRAVGNGEIDLRFSLLQPCVGFRHFKLGISSLKQVTGRDHRNVQRYIVSIIADAVPKDFALCIRSLSDFRYLAQSRSIDSHTIAEIINALTTFHKTKQAILDAGARVGKAKNPLNNFFIPKLEFFHSVAASISWSGAPIQWSADATERAHIDVIKVPSENTNNGQYGPHICRHLDRDEKGRLFDLATAIHEAGGDLESILYGSAVGGDDEEMDDELNVSWIAELDTIITTCGPSRKQVDLFRTADALVKRVALDGTTGIPQPLRTFSTPWAAFNVNRKPDISRISIDSLAEIYKLPDLRPALLDFFSQYLETPSFHYIGGRRGTHPNTQLPFTDVLVWYSLRMQTYSSDEKSVTDPRRLNAIPPCDSWSFGRYDTALFVHDRTDPALSPDVGLPGYDLAQIRLILYPIWDGEPPEAPSYMVYAQRFDIVPQATPTPPTRAAIPDPTTGLYIVKRALRANKTRVGDIIPLSHCRMPVQLVPRFGAEADRRLTNSNSMEWSKEFFLNAYFDKDIFQYLRSARP
ncbi:hypothetical protein BJ322DRAFT_1178167 [Thelephora terrestris]|uniref:DUF6830 domain-containing protein n=1 Tax=Thelephora terrestris TaxID=56493 RepID=A0A9P6HLD0_9AGAM|nr:hypothetical protein BJ322DRAFT_1178167 [Thelephora terrestris]